MQTEVYPIDSVNDEGLQLKTQYLTIRLMCLITCLIAGHTPSSADHTKDHK